MAGHSSWKSRPQLGSLPWWHTRLAKLSYRHRLGSWMPIRRTGWGVEWWINAELHVRECCNNNKVSKTKLSHSSFDPFPVNELRPQMPFVTSFPPVSHYLVTRSPKWASIIASLFGMKIFGSLGCSPVFFPIWRELSFHADVPSSTHTHSRTHPLTS